MAGHREPTPEDSGEITAILGPTNTGKTHRAVERMLTYRTGMIGLPLRLLAREIYDRVTPRIGERRVALLTGEEKRIPPRPDYWICTVESMPLERRVDFLCVDEIQLAGHRERGHTFTDRLLRARGIAESWFLGADTMREVISKVVPTATIRCDPRYSQLIHVPPGSIAGLPPRTAVVTFGLAAVYELAERIRRDHGGTAVVLGALSPRARNAQVAMYESGEVNYMVATDAIGMGLNLDLDRVVFASTTKFDGRAVRLLDPAELGQIAGRAGRYTRDGRFGVLKPLPDLGHRRVQAIQTHHFEPVRRLVWRNSDLCFASIDALIASLRVRPNRRVFRMIERADDFTVLTTLARRSDVRQKACHPEAVALLWDVCRIPDFRKLLVEHHAELLAGIYLQLTGPRARLDPQWLARNIARLDDDQGDIDALLGRIAFARTWSYVANQDRWVDDTERWRATTANLEDRLSDALHGRLTDRFVSRKGSLRRRRSGTMPPRVEVRASTSELDHNHPFYALSTIENLGDEQDLETSLPAGAIDATHEAIAIDQDGALVYRGEAIAQLRRGHDLLNPEVSLLNCDGFGRGAQAQLSRRLAAWTRDAASELVGPLRVLAQTDPSPQVRGLAYQLEQGLGTVGRRRGQTGALPRDAMRRLREVGVTLGRHSTFYRPALESARLRLRAALLRSWMDDPVPVLVPEMLAIPNDRLGNEALERLGFVACGDRALRADHLERIDARLHARVDSQGTLWANDEVAAWLERAVGDVAATLCALGFVHVEGERWQVRKKRKRRR